MLFVLSRALSGVCMVGSMMRDCLRDGVLQRNLVGVDEERGDGSWQVADDPTPLPSQESLHVK
jgi:hypothetical protein